MQLTLAARRGAVGLARHWARDRARDAGVPESVVPLIELLTSELVANAVMHAGSTEVLLAVRVDGDAFTLEVTDPSDVVPVLRTTGPEVPGGQGMRLVERLATAWGVHPRRGGGGKTVWFSVSTSAPPRAMGGPAGHNPAARS